MDISRRDFTIASGSLITGIGAGYFIRSATSDSGQGLQSPITLQNRPHVGDYSSPNQIVYWTDFECPFCQRFSEQTQTELLDKLVKNGETSFVFKILGGLEETSMPAAIAAHCVYENGLTGFEFVAWEHEMMKKFAEKDENMEQRIATIKDISKKHGVSPSKIQNAIDNEKYKDRIKKDLQEARNWQFTGTPHFLIFNRETFEIAITSGSRSYTTFENLIAQVEQ